MKTLNPVRLKLIHSKPLTARLLNRFERDSIATRCLVFEAVRWTVAREYGVHISDVNDICDRSMFERGRMAGRNEAKFFPPLGAAA